MIIIKSIPFEKYKLIKDEFTLLGILNSSFKITPTSINDQLATRTNSDLVCSVQIALGIQSDQYVFSIYLSSDKNKIFLFIKDIFKGPILTKKNIFPSDIICYFLFTFLQEKNVKSIFSLSSIYFNQVIESNFNRLHTEQSNNSFSTYFNQKKYYQENSEGIAYTIFQSEFHDSNYFNKEKISYINHPFFNLTKRIIKDASNGGDIYALRVYNTPSRVRKHISVEYFLSPFSILSSYTSQKLLLNENIDIEKENNEFKVNIFRINKMADVYNKNILESFKAIAEEKYISIILEIQSALLNWVDQNSNIPGSIKATYSRDQKRIAIHKFLALLQQGYTGKKTIELKLVNILDNGYSGDLLKSIYKEKYKYTSLHMFLTKGPLKFTIM